jgi:DNA-binding HxlR family transcriptional regulator
MTTILDANTFAAQCPARALLSRLADKWVMLVLLALRDGPMRNGALRRRIEGISQKMLTQTLRVLEEEGLVARQVFHVVPPHVEYSLSQQGHQVAVLLDQFDLWVRQAAQGKVDLN